MRRKPVSTDSKVHLLVRPDRIFSSRPCSLRPHGAQGRVKAGRRATFDASCAVSRPRLDRLSTVLRCREAVPILGMVLESLTFLRQRASPAWDETPKAARSRGPFWTRDSTRPEPAGRGCCPIVEAKPRAPTVDASSKRRTLGIPASPGADRQSGRFGFRGRHELSAVTSSPWSEAWSRICRARLTIKTTETASFQPPGR